MENRPSLLIEHAQLTSSDDESLQEATDFINKNSEWLVSHLDEPMKDFEYKICNFSTGDMPHSALRAIMRKVLLERLGIPDL